MEKGSRCGDELHHAARKWDHAVGPPFPSWLFTLTSSHILCLLEKIIFQRDWVLLTSQRSLKLKIHKNMIPVLQR
jgi:hypothetical protein